MECACIVELKALGGYAKLQNKHPSANVSERLFFIRLNISLSLFTGMGSDKRGHSNFKRRNLVVTNFVRIQVYLCYSTLLINR